MTTPRRSRFGFLPLAAIGLLALAACTTSTAPPVSATPSEPPSASPTPSGPAGTGGASAGGGSDGSTGSGTVDPGLPVDPNDPGGTGQATLVRPKPGQKDLRAVAPFKLEASVDGRHVLVKVSWYSGVEPCSVLDSVKIDRSGTAIAITPFEGTGDPNAICIELAMLKATIVDLGDLEPGTYRISAPTGDAPVLEITIS